MNVQEAKLNSHLVLFWRFQQAEMFMQFHAKIVPIDFTYTLLCHSSHLIQEVLFGALQKLRK